jgi:hypothetical protein
MPARKAILRPMIPRRGERVMAIAAVGQMPEDRRKALMRVLEVSHGRGRRT